MPHFSRMLLVLWTALLFSTAASAGPAIVAHPPRDLPVALRWARDIRWATASSVYIAAGKSGVFQVDLEGASKPKQVLDNSEANGFFLTSRLAVDGDTMIAAASWVGGVAKHLGRPGVRRYTFADTIDLDARAHHIVILGANRDDANRWAPEGALVWLGDLTGGVSNLHPILLSRSPGVQSMAFCGNLDLGAVRFISDDQFLVVPGVEPGVFLYDVAGHVKRTWQSTDLGFYDRCDVGTQEQLAFVSSENGHTAWVGQHRVLDEVIALPDAIGLIIRSVSDRRVEWSMTLLPLDQSQITTIKLPFESSSQYTHVRADAKGLRIAFLFLEYGPHTGPAKQAPRLVIADYKR